MHKVTPITPTDAAKNRKCSRLIPSFVVAVINRMLSERYAGKGSITLMQDMVIKEILADWPNDYLIGEVPDNWKDRRDALFTRGMLDFEPLFEKSGWKVVYDKPAYCESYEANWTFTAR